MSNKGCNCGGSQALKLIYACSGAANTGNATDKIARLLAQEKVGKMTCIAALGADISGFIETAKLAEDNIVIDGCPVACAKMIFTRHGISNFTHFMTTDMGMVKGETKVTEELMQKLVHLIQQSVIVTK
jgi:uncharacterized metal-binding protein